MFARMQDMLFDLIRHIHHMCETSSADELQASTLGKDKGECHASGQKVLN
jgi:hypothetical protein